MARSLRVPVAGLQPGSRRLEGATARYVARVHRRGPGDALSLFDPEAGLEADARITRVDRSGVECQIERVSASPEPGCPVGLALGLAKGEKPDRIVAEATALGARRLSFVETRRSVVRLAPDRAGARRERWRRVAVEAARQSGRGALPELQGPFGLDELVSGLRAGPRILLDRSGPPLLSLLESWSGAEELTLLVGPEGGFEPDEVDRAVAAGFSTARLGPHLLRSELAAVAALSVAVAFVSDRRERAMLKKWEPVS